ncbi:TPA: dynein regulation protein LC7 [candidate division WOR-3]|uniref:Dynein regulation protein LC7 n=1 Tax=candidate division WOR-3 bacterium TaxID=2052148 RepID=A0A348MM76_UNCW3|nr:dynein regulation protein LC7 [candidate division WOR-3 bacterium]HCP16714.1 dynein regulation protein LC7 [candidate division WOR-3 bacterium]
MGGFLGYENLSIFEQDFWDINNSLNKLLTSTNATALLLVDKAGQLITSVGNISNLDLVSFGSLAAADFAATSQLAMLIGEDEFTELFHQGKQENIYITIILSRIILVVIFGKSTNLGLIRIRIKTTVSELEKIFTNIFAKLNSSSEKMKDTFNEDFKKAAESELDDLFK